MKKYLKIFAMLLALCLLSACAGPAGESAVEEVTVESCTSEAPVETEEAARQPWADYTINSPEMAEETVRAEIARMQELGLLSQELYISEGPADHVSFLDEPDFLDRTDRPVFAVRWYCDSFYGNNWEGENRYSISANLDADTGKLMFVSIEAAADEDAEVAYTMPKMEYDENGNPIESEELWLYHENFSDIFDVEMSTNTFCDLLNEYWGFEGWTLGGGGALNLQVPLIDLTAGTTGYYHVAFTFEGDEPGKHMYIQLQEFPGRVCLVFGTDYPRG